MYGLNGLNGPNGGNTGNETWKVQAKLMPNCSVEFHLEWQRRQGGTCLHKFNHQLQRRKGTLTDLFLGINT